MEYLTRPLDRGITGALAHSYALTTHAAQGDTYDAARLLVTDVSSSKSIYVGVTRAEHDVRLYVVFADELSPSPSAHPEMPRLAPETNALTAVVNQIKDDRDELLASEIDPLAAQVTAMREASAWPSSTNWHRRHRWRRPSRPKLGTRPTTPWPATPGCNPMPTCSPASACGQQTQGQ